MKACLLENTIAISAEGHPGRGPTLDMITSLNF